MILKAANCARHVVGLVVVAAGLGMLIAPGASAETYSVKSTGELAGAVAKANGNSGANTIVLAGGSNSYAPLKTLALTNTSGVQTIEGPSSAPSVRGQTAIISGSSVEPFPSQLFIVEPGVSATIKNLEIGASGGSNTPAIEDKGSLTIEDTTLEGNEGPGVLVTDSGTLTARNSTVSEDSEFGVLVDGTASFFNSTIAFNTDGGIQNLGTLNLTNTIVAENTGRGDCVGTATTSDHSLDSNGSCDVGALSNKTPLLQENLLNDGGTTPLHSLKPGSPAIGAGDEAQCPTTDQRGAKRASPCSIGADEYNSTPPTITVPAEIVVEAEGEAGAEVSYDASAAGFENTIRTFSCVPASASTFSVGTTPVKCTAVDGHENKATKSFNVKVTPKVGPPVAPTVVTGAATAVTQTSATLNATVDPNGSQVTECTFEYGTTTAYGETASCSSLPGSGTSAVAVSAPISSLSASTTYHFRIVAKNAGGTSKGADETLKTPAAPVAPTVVTGAATAVAQTSATLNATVNPNGSEVTECTFDYGTSTAYGKTASCSSLPGAGTSAVTVSASITGLAAGTTYDFKIVAKNAGGTSDGSNATFTTAEEPKVVPKEEPKVEPKVEPKIEPKVEPKVEAPPKQEPAPDVTVTVNSATVSAQGAFALKLSCPGEDESCSGTVTVRTPTAVIASRGHEAKSKKKSKAAILTLASGSFTLSGGQVTVLTLHLSSKARALLSRSKVLRVRVTIVAHDAAGATHTTQETVTLRGAARRAKSAAVAHTQRVFFRVDLATSWGTLSAGE